MRRLTIKEWRMREKNLFNVAIVQTNSGPDLSKNVERISDIIRLNCANKHLSLIVLPENALLMVKDRNAFYEQSLSEGEHSGILAMQALAKELSVHIVIGSVAVDLGLSHKKRANRMIVINRLGAIMARYDKMHMYDAAVKGGESHRESARFLAGSSPVMFSIAGANIGCSICYDLRFPDLYSHYAKQKAHIILAPSAFTAYTGAKHWHTLIKARAIETGAFIVAPAQTGIHDGNRVTYGHSMIAGPWGDVFAEINDGEGIAFVELDITIPATYRDQIPAAGC